MHPIAHDEQLTKNLDMFAKAIGMVVIQWAQAEQMLDLLVAILWHSFDGQSHLKKIPFMLGPKIDFTRKCMASNTTLATFKVRSDTLLNEFSELSTIRHNMIHGAVTTLSPIDESILFSKLDIYGGYHHHREFRILIGDYPRLLDRLISLTSLARELSSDIFELTNHNESFIK
jgi:hypothetical protein